MTDNKLIAEFMGFAVVNKMPQAGIPESTFILEKNLKYHKSWDWLMPVVEKIEHDGHEVDIYKNACEIDMDEGMIREVAANKIEATYKAVVEFIKWYNDNKTKERPY